MVHLPLPFLPLSSSSPYNKTRNYDGERRKIPFSWKHLTYDTTRQAHKFSCASSILHKIYGRLFKHISHPAKAIMLSSNLHHFLNGLYGYDRILRRSRCIQQSLQSHVLQGERGEGAARGMDVRIR